MGSLIEILKSTFGRRTTAPGNAVLVRTRGAAGQIRETELYLPPGFAAAPAKGDQGIEIPLGSGVRVVIATHNYRIAPDVTPGERIFYSTDADGEAIQVQVKVDTAGKLSAWNSSEDLKGLIDDLIDEIIGLTTTGSSTAQATSAASVATLNALKSRFALLLGAGNA